MEELSSARAYFDCPLCEVKTSYDSEEEFQEHMAEHGYTKCPHCSNLFIRSVLYN